MPRIELKPNSPEYADSKRSDGAKHDCNIPGCPIPGDFKAPKTRGLNEYYYFCADHIRDYNKSWNFFEGMAAHEVEEHMLRNLYGDRPTWRNDMAPDVSEKIQQRARQFYNGNDGEPHQKPKDRPLSAFHHNSPEYQAMVTLGIEPPLDIAVIKKKYKDLAKKHHPDRNQGCDKSEELLKDINIAYTVLKEAFEKYEKLENK